MNSSECLLWVVLSGFTLYNFSSQIHYNTVANILFHDLARFKNIFPKVHVIGYI
jgi:hypothetical protein